MSVKSEMGSFSPENRLAAMARPHQAEPVQPARQIEQKSRLQSIPDWNKVLLPVNKLCCLLVAWLNLRAGVSRRSANIVLKALQFILVTALQLVFVVLQSAGFGNLLAPEFKLPKDIRTIYQ
ncbi:hypothetical protein B0H10DRAFT_2050105, partial [Mycena sp. CBHHK59/15]